MKKRKVMKLASRGKRLGAYCIDAVVPFISGSIWFITLIVLAIANPMSFGNDPFSDFGYGYGYGYSRPNVGGIVAAIIIPFILMTVYVVAQMVFYSKSQTIGKAILGLQVVSSDNGEPIGFWKMLFREWIVKSASASILCLGFIWVLVDEKNRGWHDKILDTYVVDLKESAKLNTRPKRKPKQKVDPVSAPAADEVVVTENTISPEVTDTVIKAAETVASTAKDIAVEVVSGEPETVAVNTEETQVIESDETEAIKSEDTETEAIETEAIETEETKSDETEEIKSEEIKKVENNEQE
ncbi:MAG: RDD family protein [Mogibacterium sp.]|nr:RDD family protein [Mogibacterium sp.]